MIPSLLFYQTHILLTNGTMHNIQVSPPEGSFTNHPSYYCDNRIQPTTSFGTNRPSAILPTIKSDTSPPTNRTTSMVQRIQSCLHCITKAQSPNVYSQIFSPEPQTHPSFAPVWSPASIAPPFLPFLNIFVYLFGNMFPCLWAKETVTSQRSSTVFKSLNLCLFVIKHIFVTWLDLMANVSSDLISLQDHLLPYQNFFLNQLKTYQ